MSDPFRSRARRPGDQVRVRRVRRRAAAGLIGTVLLATGCGPHRYPTVNADAVLASSVSTELQERMVILGVPGCPDSAQLGVLIGPAAVATPLRIPEIDGTIGATNMFGDTVPVDSPTSHPAFTLSPQSEVVHYKLARPFDGGPETSGAAAETNDREGSFTATIVWVSNGRLQTTTADATTRYNFSVVRIDRSTIGPKNYEPAAVIDPSFGVIGWLAGDPSDGTSAISVVGLEGLRADGPIPAVTKGSCPAAKLAAIAADPSLGKVDLPPLPTPTTQPPKVELPGSASFAPSVNAVDYRGNPCPTGEITATVDAYEITDPPIQPTGPFRIRVTISVTNNTTDSVFISSLYIPIITANGPDHLTDFAIRAEPGETKHDTFDQPVLSQLIEIEPIDLEHSSIDYQTAIGCST